MNVAAWIRKWALLSPDKVALVDHGQALTYRTLNQRINRVCNLLLKKGVKRGDRVVVLLHNCSAFLEIFFAASKIGAILVPLNFRLSGREIRYVVNDCGGETFFFSDSFCGVLEEVLNEIPVRQGHFICLGGESPSWSEGYEKLLDSSPSQEPSVPERRNGESPHIIMYTSGTTGLPKGAVLSERKTFFNVLNANLYYQVTSQDRIVVSRPLFHSGGLLVDSLPFLYKGATVIMKRRFDPEELVKTIEQYAVTVVETSATMYRFVLEEGHMGEYDLSSVRCFFTGGEQVPLSLLETYAERGVVISQIFGQTETSTITWLPTEHAMRKMGSVGIPVFHGEVRIVDKKGRDVPPGEIGEIIVSGPILMSGYWGKPEMTEEVIRGGWLYTGDLGVRDEEGFYHIVDRLKNVFISGGENVYPAEVEKVVLECPKVAGVAVIGVPDARWGETGKAFVVCKEGVHLASGEIREWCDGKLAAYKIPKYVEFVERIPENAAGKIVRYKLEDGSVDVMRSVNLRREPDHPGEVRAGIQELMGSQDDGQLLERRRKMAECVFCKIVKGEIPCFKVYEDDRVLAFQDINPISEGHTLIIPKEHAENLWEVPDEDLTAIHLASKRIIHAIQEALNPTGVAALQLNGKGANQVVMHYHLHLIPRLSGSPELPVTAWEFKPGDMESIRKTAAKITAALKQR